MFFKKKKKLSATNFMNSISPEAHDALKSASSEESEKVYDVQLIDTSTGAVTKKFNDLPLSTIIRELKGICTKENADNFGVSLDVLKSSVDAWIKEAETTGKTKPLEIGRFNQKVELSMNWIAGNLV